MSSIFSNSEDELAAAHFCAVRTFSASPVFGGPDLVEDFPLACLRCVAQFQAKNYLLPFCIRRSCKVSSNEALQKKIKTFRLYIDGFDALFEQEPPHQN